MITDYQKIRSAIERALNSGKKNFIIYPYGEYGVMTKQLLNDSFGITESYIVDDKLSKFNPNIKNLKYCVNLDSTQYTVLFTCANPDVYDSVRSNLDNYFSISNIIEIFKSNREYTGGEYVRPVCGKYSYGPLKNSRYVESIGAFCCFANGVCAVGNHAMDYITTHDIMCAGSRNDPLAIASYDAYQDREWYLPGIQPHGVRRKAKKSKIGNDVWLGCNVIITNGADIGNGVIACAGSVITKDVPDYAIVGGVPARIIRYRYKPEEIEALNSIAWWNWTDDEIRVRYEDLYLPVNEFIKKYSM